jgi:hypothetical protein
MSFNDPNGKLTPLDDAVAAGVGAFIGFTSSIVTQGLIEHKNINWNEVAGATAGGAVGGFLFVNPELGGPVVAGAASSATANLVQQGLNNAEGHPGFDATSLVTATAIGAATGLLPIPTGESGEIIGKEATSASSSAFALWNIGTAVDTGAGTDFATQLLNNQANLVSEKTTTAWSVPTIFNWWQVTPLAVPTVRAGTTTTTTSTQNSGGGAFSTTAAAASAAANNGNKVTTSVNNVAPNGNTSISSEWSAPPQPGQNVNTYRLQNIGY